MFPKGLDLTSDRALVVDLLKNNRYILSVFVVHEICNDLKAGHSPTKQFLKFKLAHFSLSGKRNIICVLGAASETLHRVRGGACAHTHTHTNIHTHAHTNAYQHIHTYTHTHIHHIQHTAHSTQHTAHSTQHTAHTKHTVHTQHTYRTHTAHTERERERHFFWRGTPRFICLLTLHPHTLCSSCVHLVFTVQHVQTLFLTLSLSVSVSVCVRINQF